MSDFDDLVDADGLDPEEEARLRHVHELLVQAGPPPDLPPALEQAPDEQEAEIVQFPLLPRRRWAVAAVAAATLALLAFGGGYLTGHSKGPVVVQRPAASCRCTAAARRSRSCASRRRTPPATGRCSSR